MTLFSICLQRVYNSAANFCGWWFFFVSCILETQRARTRKHLAPWRATKHKNHSEVFFYQKKTVLFLIFPTMWTHEIFRIVIQLKTMCDVLLYTLLYTVNFVRMLFFMSIAAQYNDFIEMWFKTCNFFKTILQLSVYFYFYLILLTNVFCLLIFYLNTYFFIILIHPWKDTF